MANHEHGMFSAWLRVFQRKRSNREIYFKGSPHSGVGVGESEILGQASGLGIRSDDFYGTALKQNSFFSRNPQRWLFRPPAGRMRLVHIIPGKLVLKHMPVWTLFCTPETDTKRRSVSTVIGNPLTRSHLPIASLLIVDSIHGLICLHTDEGQKHTLWIENLWEKNMRN